MRLRSVLLLGLPATAALFTACDPPLKSGPRVEFVGNSRFTTANRRLTTPGDTIANRVYASADDRPLTRLRITVDYSPTPLPIIYDVLRPAPDSSLVYLDRSLNSLDDFAFQSVQPTRTTAGLETWRYEATDADGRTGVRSFQLRLLRADSAAIFHSYTVPVQAPSALPGRRSFLALREGLVLPDFSVNNLPRNQQRIDLVYRTQRGATAPTLSLPADDSLALKWSQPRATTIRRTTLTGANFDAAGTVEVFTTAYNNGFSFARPTSTGPLAKDQVLAFRTPEEKYGLLHIQDIITTGIPTLVVRVRVSK